MALSFTLYVILKNYKCDSPNYPPIHAFTQWKYGGVDQLANAKSIHEYQILQSLC
jgi:hypothetical protein